MVSVVSWSDTLPPNAPHSCTRARGPSTPSTTVLSPLVPMATSARPLVGADVEPTRLRGDSEGTAILPFLFLPVFTPLSSPPLLLSSLTRIKTATPLHTIWLLCQLNSPHDETRALPNLSAAFPIKPFTQHSGVRCDVQVCVLPMNTSSRCQRSRSGSGRTL